MQRWSEMEKFDAEIAMRTTQLNENHHALCGTYPSIEKILSDRDNQINVASAAKYMGEKYTIGHMALVLNSVFNFVKVGKTIEAFVMPEICQMIIEQHGLWLTFADLKLCLKRGAMNLYGTTYDRIDAQVIFDWLEKYKNERFEASERRAKEKQKEREKSDYGVPMPDDIRLKMEALERKLNKEKAGQVEFKATISKRIEHLRT